MNKTNNWKDETLYPDYKQSFSTTEVLCDESSPFQHIEIIRTPSHGKVLLLDGIVQLTEKDEFIYHEMISHIPLISHPNPKHVLVIGGGDGGVINRVLQHSEIETVTLVEIDEKVISLSKKHLPKISNGAFEDKRLQLLCTDGEAFIATTDKKFDVIITDRGDDIGPGHTLFQKKFYTNCKRILNKDGILVAMTGVPDMQGSVLKQSAKILSRIFQINTCFMVTVPTYIGGQLAVTWSSNTVDPKKVPKTRIQKVYSKLNTKYYNPAIHQATFALPNSVLKLISNKTV